MFVVWFFFGLVWLLISACSGPRLLSLPGFLGTGIKRSGTVSAFRSCAHVYLGLREVRKELAVLL